jgi:hypothetical protein
MALIACKLSRRRTSANELADRSISARQVVAAPQ